MTWRFLSVSLVLLVLLFGAVIEEALAAERPFGLEALVDFVDDCAESTSPITAAHVDAMMQRLKELGVRRVSWAYYGDGHGGMLCPLDYKIDQYAGGWKNMDATYRELGNPLKVAVEAGHRHGLEVYAYFKPYETGPVTMMPEGSPQAKSMGLLPHLGGQLTWMFPFVKEHPELRIKRRTDDLLAPPESAAVHSIRLFKKDDSPTRITKEHLQIWTSESNWQYQRKPVEFQLTETVEPAPREVRTFSGKLLTKTGDSVRVLTLSGLKLTDKYILVTTDFSEGKGDFTNSGLALMTMLDQQGREIPGCFATGSKLFSANLQDFRQKGLMFDDARGASSVTLDAPNADGVKGIIAFTRGRNDYLPGALCETEPQVQAFWLQCLQEMIDAGVDGVDFREEGHSTYTDYPEDYGFNNAVLSQCGTLTGQPLLDKIAEVRGNGYTDFLRKCRSQLTSAGKRMRYNLQVDWLRPDRPGARALAYPHNIDWQWRRWIDEGLMDEAILRSYHVQPQAILADAAASDILTACEKKALPVTFNCYLSSVKGTLAERIREVRQDGRFQGFILYETFDFLKFGPEGACTISRPEVVEASQVITK